MTLICGVDISKEWLDACVGDTGEYSRFANDAEGVAGLAGFCRDAGVGLVVMEASGRYEQAPFLKLWELGQAASIVSPKSVRDFARAMGALEKTDRIDAEMIARFAQAKRITAKPPASLEQRELAALSTRMRQIASDMTIQKQRLSTTTNPIAHASLVAVIALLKAQHKSVSKAIADLIQTDPVWQALDRALRSVKGVADRTVATLLAELAEIGTISNKAIAKLVGLAPLADDSGKRQGKREIKGGRAPVRSILFLVADIARRFDPSLEAFSQRLLAAGKKKMVVRIALARKLLVRLNAKARDARQIIALSA